MGYKMKRGFKPQFMDLGSSPKKKEDSPAKIAPLATAAMGALGGSAAGTTGGILGGIGGAIGGIGMAPLAPLAALSGGLALKRKLDGTTAAEKQYEDVLEQEGLKRNFWGKLGFGGRRSRERKARIKELQAQDQAGMDRERIEAREGVAAAGPGA